MSSLLDLLKSKKQDLAAGNRRKTIKPADGTGRYKILRSWRGEDQQFYQDFGQHFIKDSTGKILAIYVCVEKTHGKPCAVCDAIRHGTKNASDDFTMKLLKEAGSSGRILTNALHLDGPNPGEVQILEWAPTAFKQFVDIATEWEEAGESVFGSEKTSGKDILISRTGTGLLTKYAVQVAAKSQPLPAGILSKLHDLDEYVNQESSEQQMRALNSVRSVVGLLPAPTSYSGAPGTVGFEEEDPYAAAPAPRARVAAPAPEPFEDVEVKVAPRPVAAKPAPAAAKPAAVKPAPVEAPAAETTGDSELDDLLAGLGA